MSKKKQHALAIMALIAVTCETPAMPMFDIVDLGGFRPEDMNNLGQIAGSLVGGGPASWDDGNLTIFNPYQGFEDDTISRGKALAVNDSGLVAGYAQGREPQNSAIDAYQAVQFVGDANNNATLAVGPTTSKSPITGQVQSQITAVNNSGTGVGIATDGTDHHRAAVFDIANNQVTDICTSLNKDCDWGQANDVNNNGLITGAFRSGAVTAFTYQNGNNVSTELIPVTGADSALPWAINDSGVAVGYSVINSTRTAVPTLWQGGGPASVTGTAIGGLPTGTTWSEARAINSGGQILIHGINTSDPGDPRHSLLVDNGNVYNLENLIDPTDPLAGQVEFLYPVAINDNGWITIYGQMNGASNGFLLEPTTAPPPPPAPQAAQLTTGSPVSLSQVVGTASDPFSFTFDYLFTTVTGVLEIRLDGALLDTIVAPSALAIDFLTHSILVDDLASLGLSNVALSFILDGPTGSSILLDNIAFPGLTNGDFQTGDLDGWSVDASSGGSAGVVDPNVARVAVPAPSTSLLMVFGLAGISFRTFHKKKAA